MSEPKNLKQNRLEISGLIRQVLLAWIVAVAIEYALLPQQLRSLAALEGLAQMSFTRVLGLTGGITVLLFMLSRFVKTALVERWGIVVAFAALAFSALQVSYTMAFLVVCLVVGAILAVYGIYGWDASPEPKAVTEKTDKVYLWITAGLATAFFLFVSAWTVGRVYSFSTPTYDFGIFSQMFYNMKESGLPMTTVERDGLLSHFDVHVSPIYYLMLPFYCLVPTPATLQVLQAAVIASSVIPLWLLGKQHGLSGLSRTLMCALMLLYPALSGGTSYDIHENCFLAPLVLWLLYGIDKRNVLITAISTLLTLMVKEDAAVYVAVIALWLIVKTLLRLRKSNLGDLITGVLMLAAALAWFFRVTGYLAESGDGVMTYRYENFMYDGSTSLLTVIKSVILNPMKAIYECVDPEKLQFIGQTLLPLLGLPLLTRRYERYILLIPYILVNLMSDYQYQHSIMFQYTFGSTACLLYLTVVNLADLRLDRYAVTALACAAAVSMGFFSVAIVPIATYYPKVAVQYVGYYQYLRDTLSQIPDGASVAATTFYTTYLSEREVLYDVRYASREHVLEAEYVVLDVGSTGDYARYKTSGKENGYANLVKLLERKGYRMISQIEGILVIYHKEQ